MILTKKELAVIEANIQSIISEENSLTEVPQEFIENSVAISKILATTGIVEFAHNAFHAYQIIDGCGSAILSITVKIFQMGYNCRKAMEENEKLNQFTANLEA